MKKALLLALVTATSVGCISVESQQVGSNEVHANGGEAVGVLQVTALGFSALFNTINIVDADFDTVVNRKLVAEAKDMGASKVEITNMATTPRSGIFSLPAIIIGFPGTQVQAIAVK